MSSNVTSKEAARIIGVAPKTLKNWRHSGKGPRFIKLGASPQAAVRYNRTEIEAWLSEREFTSTADATVSHPSLPPVRAASDLNTPIIPPAKSRGGIEHGGTLLESRSRVQGRGRHD